MAEPVCLVPGCQNPCRPGGPSFARLLCQHHREEIPAGVYAALAMQEVVIDALAERTDVLREVLWEIEPERLAAQMGRAADERLFLDLNFGNRLLLRTIAAEIPEA